MGEKMETTSSYFTDDDDHRGYTVHGYDDTNTLYDDNNTTARNLI
jgi:hypothetical protein